jgi:hypothetical protein
MMSQTAKASAPPSPARVAVTALVSVVLLAGAANAVLVPMDLTQTDHLKAYGVAYWAL